jgi:hypothetical protein
LSCWPDGQGLVIKLRTQITFGSDGTATLKLRGSEAKTLTLRGAQKEEWQLYSPEGRPLEIPLLLFRFQVYGLKITPKVWPKTCPK